MIRRVILSFVVTVIYAVVAGAIALLWWSLTHDPANARSMILEDNQWGYVFVIFVMALAAVLGGSVALAVVLTRSKKTHSALFGAGVGMVLFLMVLGNTWRSGPVTTRSDFELFGSLVVVFVMFPIGLTLTGVVASAVARRIEFTA